MYNNQSIYFRYPGTKFITGDDHIKILTEKKNSLFIQEKMKSPVEEFSKCSLKERKCINFCSINRYSCARAYLQHPICVING